MMPAMRDRPSAPAADFGACFKAASHRVFDQLRGERRHLERRDQPAQGGVASIARQRGDNPRSQAGDRVWKGCRSPSPRARPSASAMIALSGARASDCQTSSWLASPSSESRMSAICSGGRASASRFLAWPASPSRSAPAEKSVGEFLDEPVERGRRDGAEPGRGPRHRSQVRLIELLEQPRGRRLAHHQQQRRGFLGAAEFALRPGPRLRHGLPSANFALGGLFEAGAGDDLEQRHAETLSWLRRRRRSRRARPPCR